MDGFLRTLAAAIDAVNATIGRIVSWFGLFLVLAMLVAVFGRYVYGVGWIKLSEAILYAHAFLFMLGSAWTLRQDGHVRVDIFYREARPRTKAWINLVGVVLFLLPVMVLIGWVSWPYVGRAWAIREGSREISGIHLVYLLKTAIIVFAVQIGLQGIALAARSVLALRGDRDELAALSVHGADTPVAA
jgi:TRAP-type mannitol/chloroaromatic compound transport system permease small subunit